MKDEEVAIALFRSVTALAHVSGRWPERVPLDEYNVAVVNPGRVVSVMHLRHGQTVYAVRLENNGCEVEWFLGNPADKQAMLRGFLSAARRKLGL
jgi:hypothetical protein